MHFISLFHRTKPASSGEAYSVVVAIIRAKLLIPPSSNYFVLFNDALSITDDVLHERNCTACRHLGQSALGSAFRSARMLVTPVAGPCPGEFKTY